MFKRSGRERRRWTGEMKMPHRQTETHCQRHAGGGTSETAEETKESEGRPIAVTKAEFNHHKYAAEAEVERVYR